MGKTGLRILASSFSTYSYRSEIGKRLVQHPRHAMNLTSSKTLKGAIVEFCNSLSLVQYKCYTYNASVYMVGEFLNPYFGEPSGMISNIDVSRGNLKAILLDLDDTIVTDDAVNDKTWQKVCQRFAPFVGGISADELCTGIRRVSKSYWKNHENHRKGRLNLEATRRQLVRLALRDMCFDNKDELADKISYTYTAEKESAIAPIPGALETLHCFKDSGLRLALITNGAADIQRAKISRFELAPIFDFILIEGEFGMGKPHPSVFRAVMDKLDVDVPDVWMVGDDLERDIAGAQSLGIYSIWVDWRGAGLPSHSIVQPDCIVRSIAQMSEENRCHCRRIA